MEHNGTQSRSIPRCSRQSDILNADSSVTNKCLPYCGPLSSSSVLSIHAFLCICFFFFWRSCVARIYCFARPNRGACSQAILGEKGELWGERDGGGEPCRGLRRADHSLSPAFFRYFALRLLLAIFPLKEALSQVNSNQEWPGPNRSKTGTLFLSGLLLGFSFTKVLLCVFAPSCMS